eukprot:m.47526 g.47526  ORF g.47526 m.47526 type:complete len:90 (-) comp7337_c0_seq1:820-1089(-)
MEFFTFQCSLCMFLNGVILIPSTQHTNYRHCTCILKPLLQQRALSNYFRAGLHFLENIPGIGTGSRECLLCLGCGIHFSFFPSVFPKKI